VLLQVLPFIILFHNSPQGFGIFALLRRKSTCSIMRGALTVFFFVLATVLLAQTPCTNPGQTPATAFPVCGTSTFTQASVPLCGGRKMPYRGCGNDLLSDINPFWYKFTCFQSGTLGFTITPNDNRSDYDWELYDITGRNPDDVFTDDRLVISNNWSGETGLTGASQAGTQQFVCGGLGRPLFSRMPQLTAGRNYLLLVSHFTNTQAGYKLAFGGGTAVITDSTKPHLQKVEASCGGDMLRLKLNKKMKCSSLSANGSEFLVMPGNISVRNSTGINCSSQFDTDSIQLQLASFLAPGNYTLHIKKGNDDNTLLDYCDQQIAETETLPFTVLPKAPTPMDSMAALNCAPTQVRLLFKKPILCSSIAANGSDFTVSGAYPVVVTGASGNCTGAVTREVVVRFSAPLQSAGNFQIRLQKGADGNTLQDECGEETPVGSALPFSVQDTVDAAFTYHIGYGCERDTVVYFHNGANGVNQWQWQLDEGQSSTLQNATALYSIFNQKRAKLWVSNGFCTDSSEQTIALENFLKADFTVFEDNCPNEAVSFTSMAQGKIVGHLWEFGDGGSSGEKDAKHTYANPGRQTAFPVRYTVLDEFGCRQTAVKNVNIYSSCYLAMPTAFTPNGDGRNDVFRVLNAVKAEDLELTVFNRWGQVVFRTKDWKKGWDGRINGELQPTAVYVWLLRYTSRDTKKRVEQKGTVMLVK
jgi:gliding motility-associated-like protein